MGQFVRTIVIGVPVKVVYSAIKEFQLSALEDEWSQGTKWGFVVPWSLSRDVPDSELIFSSSKMGSKAELRFVLRSLQESLTEVTLHVKHKWVLSPESTAVQVRDALRMLEYGYKSKIS